MGFALQWGKPQRIILGGCKRVPTDTERMNKGKAPQSLCGVWSLLRAFVLTELHTAQFWSSAERQPTQWSVSGGCSRRVLRDARWFLFPGSYNPQGDSQTQFGFHSNEKGISERRLVRESPQCHRRSWGCEHLSREQCGRLL